MNLLHLRTFQFAFVCGATLFTLSEANAMLKDPIDDKISNLTIKHTQGQTSSSHYLDERSAEVIQEQIDALHVVMTEPTITRKERDDLELELSLLYTTLNHQQTVEEDVAKENKFSVKQLIKYAQEDCVYGEFYQKVLQAEKLGIEEFIDENHLNALIAAHDVKGSGSIK